MGNPKQKWTAEEEEALRAGIAKYGAGKWKFIQRDPEFNKHLHSRSNIDLKDKWRNISAIPGQGSREKSRIPKQRTTQDAVVTPMVSCQTAAHALTVVHDSPADLVKDDPSKDTKNGPKFNAMVFEALSTTEEPSGLDIGSLVTYIEQRAEVPQNFRKLLGSRLRRLVAQEKLEKVDNCYRIKDASLSETKPASLKEIQPRQSQSIVNVPRESLEAAVTSATLSIAKAEDSSFQAAEAAREEERAAKMAEMQAQIVQLAIEIHERCVLGETVLTA